MLDLRKFSVGLNNPSRKLELLIMEEPGYTCKVDCAGR